MSSEGNSYIAKQLGGGREEEEEEEVPCLLMWPCQEAMKGKKDEEVEAACCSVCAQAS